jgi:hypothetical protein
MEAIELAVSAVTLVIRILETLGSNLGRDTGYYERFNGFFLVLSGRLSSRPALELTQSLIQWVPGIK